jgi:peroxiredoxin Q/BCP
MEKKRDSIPNFKAKDTNGNDFDSQMLIGQKPLVIYFTPKTIHGMYRASVQFSRSIRRFQRFAEVIGISSDTESHRNLLNSTNYLILLSDHDKKMESVSLFHQECSGCFGRTVMW